MLLTNQFVMESVIIHAKNKKDLKIIVDVAKHLKAVVEPQESPYDPEFVAKIKEGETQFDTGNGVKIDVKNLWK